MIVRLLGISLLLGSGSGPHAPPASASAPSRAEEADWWAATGREVRSLAGEKDNVRPGQLPAGPGEAGSATVLVREEQPKPPAPAKKKPAPAPAEEDCIVLTSAEPISFGPARPPFGGGPAFSQSPVITLTNGGPDRFEEVKQEEQPPGVRPMRMEDMDEDETANLRYAVQLEPPGPDRLFRLESDAAFRERIRQENRQRPKPEFAVFPDEPPLSTAKGPAPRAWPLMAERAEPQYLCTRRQLFEELNSERYGWDLGIIQPFVSVLHFYGDLAALPIDLLSAPWWRCDCTYGYCLPGSPVPYLLYPPTWPVPQGAFAKVAANLRPGLPAQTGKGQVVYFGPCWHKDGQAAPEPAATGATQPPPARSETYLPAATALPSR
jgi:hypothetical protein